MNEIPGADEARVGLHHGDSLEAHHDQIDERKDPQQQQDEDRRSDQQMLEIPIGKAGARDASRRGNCIAMTRWRGWTHWTARCRVCNGAQKKRERLPALALPPASVSDPKS